MGPRARVLPDPVGQGSGRMYSCVRQESPIGHNNYILSFFSLACSRRKDMATKRVVFGCLHA
jgi:hypothetical protein